MEGSPGERTRLFVRLILATDDVRKTEEIAERIFNSLQNRDDEVHLHIAEKEALPVF